MAVSPIRIPHSLRRIQMSERKKKIRWMLWFRKLHLYLGCFFTPMLMFYILTGLFQTVNEDRLKHPGEAQTLMQKARVVHTDFILPPDVKEEDLEGIDLSQGIDIKESRPATYKWLAILMCIMASVTIALGLVLSFKTIKKKWLVATVLVVGCALPYLMLKLGQGGL